MNFIEDVLAGRISLPAVPKVVERVLTTIRRQDASLNDVAQELELDPVLSSRLLRLANSSFFGGRRSVSSVSDAVSLVGLKSLQTLVVACGVHAAFTQVPAVNLRHFWLASVLTATSARQLAQRMGLPPDDAYSAGLLQGVGHLILCQCHPEEALFGFSSVASLWGRDLAEQEISLFGTSHPEVSAIWVDRLGLPETVVTAIAHMAGTPGANEQAHTLSAVLILATSLAAGASYGDSLSQTLQSVDKALVSALGLNDYLASEDACTDFGELMTVQTL
ncbi:HDOD domain-containing protein [Aquabacterium sp.]|uniref:HDOD domain-containing protein n=1 Tax=Aquabacterium sp. TaxID=1872578 RepID=UPI0025C6A2F8|nr:HDOD domain-containing protein [Aquabacterium sp.]